MAKMSDVVVNNLNTVEMTVRVRLGKRFKYRMWIALKLIRLAARILPFGVNVEVEDA